MADAGNYILEFGVVDWSDQGYDSGLAFDGITVGGKPIVVGAAKSKGSAVVIHAMEDVAAALQPA